MRCGPGTVSLKLNFPVLSVLVLPPTSMPLARLMRMTSSPTAGLPVVPLVTVPESVWAAAEARASERMAASNADCTSLVKSTPLIADPTWQFVVQWRLTIAAHFNVTAALRQLGSGFFSGKGRCTHGAHRRCLRLTNLAEARFRSENRDHRKANPAPLAEQTMRHGALPTRAFADIGAYWDWIRSRKHEAEGCSGTTRSRLLC